MQNSGFKFLLLYQDQSESTGMDVFGDVTRMLEILISLFDIGLNLTCVS
jgi:hypothetical protein